MIARAAAALFALSAGLAQAQAPDALQWLRRIHEAPVDAGRLATTPASRRAR